MTRTRVLFVCTHNSARSQMAEAMVNAWAGDSFEAHSAGTNPAALHPDAIVAMSEIGLDLDGHWSKSIDYFLGEPFQWSITLCDDAETSCPVLPGADRLAHWSIDDPAAVRGTPRERYQAFRTARDQIRDRVHAFLLVAGRGDSPAPTAVRLATHGHPDE